MKNAIRLLAAAVLIFWPGEVVRPQQSRTRIEQPFAAPAKVTAPVVLCIDDKPQGGGQPSTQAYAKAAGNGFRSVLTLRSSEDGVDLIRERFMVEQSKMRYYNISASKSFPRRQQVDEFLSLVRDEANHPMLINCAFAERVAPYMMIFRVVEQGWNKSRAVEEAARSGLESKALRKYLDEYLTRLTKNHR